MLQRKKSGAVPVLTYLHLPLHPRPYSFHCAATTTKITTLPLGKATVLCGAGRDGQRTERTGIVEDREREEKEQQGGLQGLGEK